MLPKQLTGRFKAGRAAATAGGDTQKLRTELEQRDAAIGELQQANAELQSRIEELERQATEAGFRSEVLEQGYSTQLTEARVRAQAAESELVALQETVAEIEADRRELRRELDGARARLESISPQEAATIDELLEACSVGEEAPDPRARTAQIAAKDARVSAQDTQVLDDMIAPDVMLAGKRKQSG